MQVTCALNWVAPISSPTATNTKLLRSRLPKDGKPALLRRPQTRGKLCGILQKPPELTMGMYHCRAEYAKKLGDVREDPGLTQSMYPLSIQASHPSNRRIPRGTQFSVLLSNIKTEAMTARYEDVKEMKSEEHRNDACISTEHRMESPITKCDTLSETPVSTSSTFLPIPITMDRRSTRAGRRVKRRSTKHEGHG